MTSVALSTKPRSANDTAVRLNPPAKALLFRGPVRGFELVAVPSVNLKEGEALVKIELATVCGSDHHTARGHRTEATPVVLGHEQVGRVVALGPGGPPRSVDGRDVAVGDRVIWGVAVSCGKCRTCRRGLTNKCEHLQKYGHTRFSEAWELSGGFATHVHLIQGTDIVIVPEEMPAELLAPASCATATVMAAVEAAALARPLAGQTALVNGCGMLGLTAVAALAQAGSTVIAIDPDPYRRLLATKFGASIVADPNRRNLIEALAQSGSSGGEEHESSSFTVAMEMSGAPEALVTLLNFADVGAVIVLVGSVFPAKPVPVSAEQMVRNLITITGVHNYRKEHLLKAVEFLKDCDQDLFQGLVEEVVTFNGASYAMMQNPIRGTRIAITPK